MSINNHLKITRWVTIPLLLVLLAGALFFYRERMLFLDAPHVLFRIINSNSLQVVAGRYGSFITQLFPLAGMQLHLPLQSLMLLYSASFNTFYITVALLLVYRYKRYDLALLLAFYLTLFVSDTYFWTNNEVHQGITWLLLGLGISFYPPAHSRPVLLALLFTLCLFLAIFSHPLVMFVALYLWFFYMLEWVDWPFTKRQTVAYSLVLLAVIGLKYLQSRQNWYDGGKISAVTGFKLSRLQELPNAPQMRMFLKGCLTNYWLLTLLFLAGIIAMVKEKKYRALLLTLFFAVGYGVFICIAFWDQAGLRFYMESEYMPVSIIACAPFVCYVLPRCSKPLAVGVLIFIFAVRLVYIANAAPTFTKRVALLERIEAVMKAQNVYKAIIPDTSLALANQLIMDWGAPVESLMLSALEKEQPQRTFIVLPLSEIPKNLAVGRDTLIGGFEKRHATKLNAGYFKMDTTQEYRVMGIQELLKWNL